MHTCRHKANLLDVVRTLAASVALAIILPARPLAAQAPYVFQYNTVRVRQMGSDSLLQGAVESIRDTTLLLRMSSGELRSVPRSSILAIDVLTRRGHALTGAAIGGAVGVALAAIVSNSVRKQNSCEDEGDIAEPLCEVLVDGWLIATTWLVGVGGGIALGALAGSSVKTDVWVPARLARPNAALTARLQLGLSLRL